MRYKILWCLMGLTTMFLLGGSMLEVVDISEELVETCSIHETRISALEKEVHKLEEKSDTAFYDSIPLSIKLQNFTYDLCVDYGVEDHYELVLAMMWQESNFNANVISATNDYGIMQINVINHPWLQQTLGITNFLDAEQNITAGVHMISNLLHKYDTESKALMAYNLGEGGAAAKWRNGIYSTDYSERILEKKEKVLNNMYI